MPAAKKDGPPAPPWPGLDAWLRATPETILGRDGATLIGLDPDTWGMDVSNEPEFPAPGPPVS